MFKKFSLFLLLIMIGFVLVACGNGEETAGDQQEETTTDEENTEEESTNEESGSDYPSKPIQIIVPYSAGGGGDTVARILAEPLSEKLGVQVNVVNRDGAGGEIGISEMANARQMVIH
ncbi:tricarboxylate transport protein TctC [Gracilibacillus boraciitolerans JCM 21714]|uniref:Tricarboxylate transport protein TctC n=1 Tax=Gracilibacillus boraciitolerans JCM 21714 TaxID=1298598 RepID=W4VHV6_9BACI|nr:tricarboxylate transport protein TctC [Gracilibacillus boraciitolerans JCM 21714]